MDAAKPDNLELLCSIICRSGFTSRSEVTDVSGRGVGMDGVKAELDLVGGALKLESTSPAGTCFTFSWPAQDERSQSRDKGVATEKGRAAA